MDNRSFLHHVWTLGQWGNQCDSKCWLVAGCFYTKKVESVVLSCIPALLCDEHASHLRAVPWDVQGRVVVPKDMVTARGQPVCAFRGLTFQVLPGFFPLEVQALGSQGSQDCCGVMGKLDQEEGMMLSLLLLLLMAHPAFNISCGSVLL